MDDLKMLEVINLLWQLKEVIDFTDENKEIYQVVQEVENHIIKMENLSNLVEVVEVGRGVFSVER